jgi:hypothetical protein
MFAEKVLKGENLKFKQISVTNWRRTALKILQNEVLIKSQENQNQDEEIVVDENKSRKRKKVSVNYRTEQKKKRTQDLERQKKRRENLSENQKDTTKQKDSDSRKLKRENEELRSKEFAQINDEVNPSKKRRMKTCGLQENQLKMKMKFHIMTSET